MKDRKRDSLTATRRARELPLVIAVGLALPAAGCSGGDKTQATAETSAPAKTASASVATKSSSSAAPQGSSKPDVVIKKPEDIPVELGGAVAPRRPPPPPASSAAPGAAPAPAAAAAASPRSDEVRIVHNHPPDQPCNQIDRADVQKALDDLKQTR